MKNYRKAVEERQSQILSIVSERKEVRVEELAELCNVSMMTVRRDLKLLDEQGLLHRTHGGALSRDKAEVMSHRGSEVQYWRELISRFAARYVSDGDTLFINGSRTALELLHYLPDKKVTVYTNNAWAATESFPEQISVILTGGELSSNVMIGEYVIQNLLSLSADKTFLGCAAVYDDGEFRYDIPTEIGINEVMISRTRGDLYILADHTKLRRRGLQINAYGSFRYNCPVTLVTDELADKEIVRSLRSQGIVVVQVSES